MLFPPRQQAVITIGLVIATILVAATIGLAATRAATIGRSRPAQEAAYGPQLYLVEGTNLGALDGLTRLSELTGQVPRVVASGAAAEASGWNSADALITLLDGDTSGQVYYLIEAQSQPEAARSLAAVQGRILFDGGAELVLGVDSDNELSLLETLPAKGIAIARISPQGVPVRAPSTPPAALRTVVTTSPLITGLLTQITPAALESRIRQLSGEVPVNLPGRSTTLDTRYTFSTRIGDAEEFLLEYHKALGLNPSYAQWTYGSYSGKNVIVDIPGVENPEKIWVIGGHFDTNSEIPYSSAPGADDNGSGTASTMLIAQILKEYSFRDTIRFVYFSGEEQGQWGSLAYANSLRQAGVDVQGYINLDMIGYDGNGDRVVELHTGSESTNPRSNALALSFIDAANRYGQGLSFERKSDSASRFSDHRSFWDNNYAAFLVIENFFTDAIGPDRNPYYHNTKDRIGSVDLDYVTRIARTALASISELAGIVDPNDPPTATVTPSVTSTPTDTGAPTATPTTTVTQTPTATATDLPGGCQDIVQNGGFEDTSSLPWALSGAYPGAIVDSPVQSGSHAARAGIPDTVSNRFAYSTIYQRVTIPTWPTKVLLTYWEQPNGGGDGVDAREVLLLNTSLATVATIDRQTTAGDGEWRQRTFDLTAYKGRSLILYFNVYNNGDGGRLWSYLDDVALLACNDEATATPTASSTPAETPTADADGDTSFLPYVLKEPAPTQTPTATATETPTSTPTPTATATATETAVDTETPTATMTPTETATSTATATATSTSTTAP